MGFSSIDAWYKKEDYWAIIVALVLFFVMIVGFFGFGTGFFKTMAVNFPSWSTDFNVVTSSLQKNFVGLTYLFVFFAAVFTLAAKYLGYNTKHFTAGFAIIFILSVFITVLASNQFAKDWQLESAFLALLIGMVVGNFTKLPEWFHASLRTEFYVKTGIVLMGATLPFTVIVQAGPMAILQATIVAATTFFAIYFAATKLFGLDPRFGATLGAGGSICGVSASIAIGSACRAEKQHVSVAITLVIVWAVFMIFTLPVAAKFLGMEAGPTGAWIGTSEFADAAGFAAAAAVGDERAVTTFTLMKVVGRDVFVGIWALLVAILSVTLWEKKKYSEAEHVDKLEIWRRFPKFVIGFFIASILTTIILASVDSSIGSKFSKEVLGYVKNFRGWAFTWTFLCIGLTTRFRELSSVGWKPLAAFSVGVLINVPLGYLLSNVFFVDFWLSLK